METWWCVEVKFEKKLRKPWQRDGGDTKIRTRSLSRPFEALSLTEASAIIIKGGALEAQAQNQSAKPSLLIKFF